MGEGGCVMISIRIRTLYFVLSTLLITDYGLRITDYRLWGDERAGQYQQVRDA